MLQEQQATPDHNASPAKETCTMAIPKSSGPNLALAPLVHDEIIRRRHKNADICTNQIASLANRLEREFFFGMGEVSDDAQDNERVELFLYRLRDAISQIGYLADLATAQISPSLVCIGDAEEWLTPPVFDKDAAKAKHARDAEQEALARKA